MNKWLSVELSLLLLVSLVAFAGFVSYSSEDLGDERFYDVANELSGQLRWSAGQRFINKFRAPIPTSKPVLTSTSVSPPTSTGLYNGLGRNEIVFDAPKQIDKLTGQTCFYHKKTGDYYRFTIEGYNSGNIQFKIYYPSATGWFGGKGGKCEQISLDLKGTPPVSKIVISGVVVKGRPNVYSNKFDVKFMQTPTLPLAPVSSPSPTLTPVPTKTTTPEPTCIDSDGGLNYYFRGITTERNVRDVKKDPRFDFGRGRIWGSNPNKAGEEIIPPTPNQINYYDACFDSKSNYVDVRKQLVESYCVNNQVSSQYVSCPFGCKEGVCMKTQPDIKTKKVAIVEFDLQNTGYPKKIYTSVSSGFFESDINSPFRFNYASNVINELRSQYNLIADRFVIDKEYNDVSFLELVNNPSDKIVLPVTTKVREWPNNKLVEKFISSKEEVYSFRYIESFFKNEYNRITGTKKDILKINTFGPYKLMSTPKIGSRSHSCSDFSVFENRLRELNLNFSSYDYIVYIFFDDSGIQQFTSCADSTRRFAAVDFDVSIGSTRYDQQIGVIVHELGHLLGLSDGYEIGSQNYFGTCKKEAIVDVNYPQSKACLMCNIIMMDLKRTRSPNFNEYTICKSEAENLNWIFSEPKILT